MQPTIEVAIGLMLLMVVFSVLVSASVETVSLVLAKRARHLEQGVLKMLVDPGGLGRRLGDEVLGHPLVVALRKGRRGPSYLAPEVFSAAVTDALTKAVAGAADANAAIDGLPDGELKQRLQAIRREASDTVADLRVDLEAWFDHQMDRVSGWYTRWAQVVMLVVGVAVALVLNVSAVTVARVLWNDPVLRTELVAEAESAAESGDGAEEPDTAVGGEVELSRFPIGWNDTAWPGLQPYLALHLLGILALGLAASLGAPFWFDALSRFSNLRAAGPRPERAPPSTPPPPATLHITTGPS
jgi:hypothetical protein